MTPSAAFSYHPFQAGDMRDAVSPGLKKKLMRANPWDIPRNPCHRVTWIIDEIPRRLLYLFIGPFTE
jgi:hypothetical protein